MFQLERCGLQPISFWRFHIPGSNPGVTEPFRWLLPYCGTARLFTLELLRHFQVLTPYWRPTFLNWLFNTFELDIFFNLNFLFAYFHLLFLMFHCTALWATVVVVNLLYKWTWPWPQSLDRDTTCYRWSWAKTKLRFKIFKTAYLNELHSCSLCWETYFKLYLKVWQP